MIKAWVRSQTRLCKLLILAVCVGAGSLTAQVAQAQSAQERAMARALFEEGVKFADQARWDEAVDRFRRAQSIKPSPGITFNLAWALAQTGKLIEASDMLEALARDPQTPPELKHESEAKLAEITPKRAFLTLQVHNAPAAAHVQLDGQEWPRAVWGVASPIDPGDHVALGTEGSAELARANVQLAAGEHRELSLDFPQAAPLVAASPPPQTVAPRDDEGARHSERKPLYKNWILWASVGAVVAGGVIAAAVVTHDGGTKTQSPVSGNAGVIRW
jgi:tetratricopeptide (TPR) repeat protein